MNPAIVNKIEQSQLKNRPDVQVGDSVKLYMKISEGGKERTQIYAGIVIALKGSGLDKTLTVRKISYGVGVEKIVPLHSPSLEKIEVVKRVDKTNKSKLYYMRKRVGKRALKVGATSDLFLTDQEEVAAEVVESAPEMQEEAAQSSQVQAEQAPAEESATTDSKEE